MSKEKTNNNLKGKSRFRKIFNFTVRWSLRAFIGLIILLLLFSVFLIIASKTDSFQKWSADKVSSIVSDVLLADLEVGKIKFTALNGIEITDVKFLAGGDTLAETESVIVDFDIMPLLNSRVKVNNLDLVRPKVKLLRDKDSVWNFQKIAEPTPDTTEGGKSPWVIDISGFNLVEGEMTVFDSTAVRAPEGKIDYTGLLLEDLNIEFDAEIAPGDNKFGAEIRNISFLERKSGFKLISLSLDALVDSEKVKVSGLKLRTPETQFNLDAVANNTKIFDPDVVNPFAESVINIQLDAANISASDVSYFTPEDLILNGDYVVNLSAEGNYDDIELKYLDMFVNKSEIRLSGKVNSLRDPENLQYRADISKIYFRMQDIRKALPGILPDALSHLHSITLDNTTLSGSTDSVYADFRIHNDIGRMEGKAGVRFSGDMAYFADISTHGLDLSPILNSPDLKSEIDSRIIINGRGTDPEKMTAEVRIESNNSFVQNINYDKLVLEANTANGRMIMDTIIVEFMIPDIPEYLEQEIPGFFASGSFSLAGEKPSYAMNAKFNGLDIASLTGAGNAPEYLTGRMKVEGSGIDPDKIDGKIELNVDYALFGDRAMMPFDLKLNMEQLDSMRKKLTLESEFLDATLSGKFSFNQLIPTLQTQGVYLVQYIQKRMRSVNPDMFPEDDTTETIKTGSFPDVNFDLRATINDISSLSLLTGGISMYVNANIGLRMIAGGNESRVNLDSIRITRLTVETPGANIHSRPLNISGEYFFRLQDSTPSLKNLSMALDGESQFVYNDLVISAPSASVSFMQEFAEYYASAEINNIFAFSTGGELDFYSDHANLTITQLQVSYIDKFQWKMPNPAKIEYSTSGIDLRQFVLERENAERISLSGQYDFQRLDSVILIVSNFPASTALDFMPADDNRPIETISGGFDTLKVEARGPLDNPLVDISFNTSELMINEIYAGVIQGNLKHRSGIFSGSVGINDKRQDKTKQLMLLDIKSLPFKISSEDAGFSSEEFDALFKANELPLVVASPFIPPLLDLKGYMDAEIKLTGVLPDEINYSGDLNMYEASFVLAATNIRYLAEGKLHLETDRINIDNLTLRNTNDDLSRGKALIYGHMKIDKFIPEQFDIKFKSERFLILANSTRKTMPTLYGTFIIQTGDDPLNFSGSLERPSFTGDVNILQAYLNMPMNESSQNVESRLRYIRESDKLIITDTSIVVSADTTAGNKTEKQQAEFVENLYYDLQVKILGRFEISMDLFTFSSLEAVIGTPDRAVPIRITKYRVRETPVLSGRLELKDGSKLTLYKTFQTTGEIYFPTGSIENPGLDLEAVHSFDSFNPQMDEETNYTVWVHVSGTKDKPKIRFDYAINGVKQSGDSTEIAENAIFLLLFGQTKAQMLSGTGGGSGDFLGGAATSGASLVGSSALTQILSQTGIIESAGIDFTGGTVDLSQARLSLTGQLFENVRWEVGGSVADLASNNEIKIDIPLATFLNTDLNINLQLMSSSNMSSNPSTDQKKWGVKIKFGGSW